MLLFMNPADLAVGNLVVPLARVYDIYCTSCSVIVNYDSGELIEVDGTYQKKLQSVRIVFDSPDEANKSIRQLYKAVSKGSQAFYFGSTDNEKKN